MATYYDPIPLGSPPGNYSRLEFSKLLNFISKTGVKDAASLKVTGVTQTLAIAAGGCVVAGTDVTNQGLYTCWMDGGDSITLTAAPAAGSYRIDLVFAKVYDDTGGAPVSGGTNQWKIVVKVGTVISGALPSTWASTVAGLATAAGLTSSLLLGAAAVQSTGTTIYDARVIAEHPGLSGRVAYTGSSSTPVNNTLYGNMTVNGEVTASGGIQLGAAFNPLMRHFTRISRSTQQAIPDSSWTAIGWDTADVQYTDYSLAPWNGAAQLRPSIAGVYSITGQVQFVDPTGTNVGTRQSRIAVFNSAGAYARIFNCVNINASSLIGEALLTWSATVDLYPGEYIHLQAWQSQGSALNIDTGGYSTGGKPYASFALVQAF